jgi:hypothetical protein
MIPLHLAAKEKIDQPVKISKVWRKKRNCGSAGEKKGLVAGRT